MIKRDGPKSPGEFPTRDCPKSASGTHSTPGDPTKPPWKSGDGICIYCGKVIW
jgi:hypothetical protein